ncbi:hypothetical protein D046_5418, partial [Vibrio parahaemolyticus V-223/04]
MCEKQMP